MNVYSVWRFILDENEKLARARLATVQMIQVIYLATVQMIQVIHLATVQIIQVNLWQQCK